MGKVALEGEDVKLKKPIAVMALDKSESGEREYCAVGIVREKMVFKSRPVPVCRPQMIPSTSSSANKRKRISDSGPEPVVA